MALDEHPVVLFGERLIAEKAKRGDWDEKAQRRARQIRRLLGKSLPEQGVAGPGKSSRRHVTELADLLGAVAKSSGESPKDEFRTIAELRAIGAGKPEADRGLGALNRRLANLSHLAPLMKAQGVRFEYEIDLRLLRVRTRTRGRVKRAVLDRDELSATFNLPCFLNASFRDGDAS